MTAPKGIVMTDRIITRQDNHPPPLEAMSLHIEDLFTLTSDSIAGLEAITTDKEEAACTDLLEQWKQAGKDANAAHDAEKKPHLEAGRQVDIDWKPPRAKVLAGVATLKALLTPYRDARQRRQDSAAAKMRAEAEAAQEVARVALRQSEDMEERFDAEVKLEQAAALAATANKIDRRPTGMRTRQVAVIFDRRKLLEHIMRTDPDWLTAWLTEYAQRALPRKLPGVDITTERNAA
jgi:hypothetical protein